jgi:lysophospholipase L1-like esterase
MRVLVFGASVTQGFWDTEGGWVQRLRKHYDEMQIKNWSNERPTIFNLGVSGDSTIEVLKRVENETLARQTDRGLAFIFSVGINDSFVSGNGNINLTPEQYADNYRKIISIAKKYSDKIMLLGLQYCDESKTRPVAWANIHYTNERIEQFDQKAKQIAEENKIPYSDLYELFRARPEKGEGIYQDGLHPNNEGHELIFQLVRPALDELLSSK